ncbi:AAA family ATPase [Desulfoluna butyratoxydans]|uniref:Cytidylate kinase-like family n=1 Tax=Desulfoluna butyratoxydans TaxID=231438 RepID=A0A4U8YSI8_9BACT|nr:cytidylate kinase-like family protein [Desulfoluna butyratoxydans]VFQ46477.1 cytidylate kinase-like family [Desulfoluna butyratoxydans]
MSIITISRSFCSKGSLVAERIAAAMGYDCISREILLEASEQFNVPEIKLARAIHDGPSVYDRFSHGKECYIAFIKAALLNRLKKGNVVYHGLAGHFFVQDIPHILKIRLLSDMQTRIADEMAREQVTEEIARKRIAKDDKERCNWSHHLYKIDTRDPELYDLSINLRHVSVEDCVTIIRNTADLAYFRESGETKNRLENLALAATVRASLVNRYYNAEVTTREGSVVIKLPDPVTKVDKTKEEIRALLTEIKGIKDIYMDIKSSSMPRTAMHK